MVGIVLMVIGAILVGIALFGFFSYALSIIGMFLLAIVRVVCGGLYHMFNHSRINSDYVKYKENEKIAEENSKKAKIEARKQKALKEANDRLVYSTTKQVNDLKIRYPLADSYLFDEFVTAFTTRTVDEAEQIKSLIKEQHTSRMNENQSFNNNNKYTVEEVVFFDKMDEDSAYDITCTIYKNEADYILLVMNRLTNVKIMYTSKNPVVVKQMMQNMINKDKENANNTRIQLERNNKKTLSTADINDIIAYTLNECKGEK